MSLSKSDITSLIEIFKGALDSKGSILAEDVFVRCVEEKLLIPFKLTSSNKQDYTAAELLIWSINNSVVMENAPDIVELLDKKGVCSECRMILTRHPSSNKSFNQHSESHSFRLKLLRAKRGINRNNHIKVSECSFL